MKDFKELINIADVYGTETKGLAEQREAEIQKNLDEGMWDDLVGGISSLAKKLGIDPATADKVANTISTQPEAKAEVEKADPGTDPTGNTSGKPTVDGEMDMEVPAEDDFGGADAAAGGEELGGREKRESIQREGLIAEAQDLTKAKFVKKHGKESADLTTPNIMKAYNDGGKQAMPTIKNMQTALSRLGFDPNGLDGKYGNGTFKAVQEFQKANGLAVDGQAGPSTMAAIKKALDDNFDANKVTPADSAQAAAPTVQTASKDNNMNKNKINEASMNISMNGNDASEVADLVKLLQNAGMPQASPVSDIPTMSLSGPGSPLNKGPIGLGAFDGGPMDDKPRSMMDKPSSGPFDGGPMDDKPGSASGGKSCDVCGGMHEEYDAIVAEWDNSPDPEYKDSDYMINDLAGGIKLKYNTNLTNIPPKMIEYWSKFKRVQLNCSIDAVGHRDRYIRYPSSWEKVEKNFDELSTFDNVDIQIH